VQRNDIVVGGKNWGCGSSREQAVVCLKESGVGVIIAKSFARIYYRNCINNALPAITSPQAVDAIENGETISVDLKMGEIHCSNGSYTFPPIPEAVMGIFKAGGLIQFTRNQLTKITDFDI
jgi:3-isopropylmalate/(R)-2-methylmalate dehydratase small subunit